MIMFTVTATAENINVATSGCSQNPIYAPVITAAAVSILFSFSAPSPVFEVEHNRPIVANSISREYFNSNNILFLSNDIISNKKIESLARLVEIGGLQDNWNGNGASHFSNELLDFAKGIILDLSIQPAIFPTARDSIQLEYENNLGDYLEFELFNNKKVTMFSFNHIGTTENTAISCEEINELVGRFYGRDI